MDRLDQMVRAVSLAVKDRLGPTDSELVQLVVREVVTAMISEESKEPGTVSPPGSSAPMRENADGTVTTGLGSVLPRPPGTLPLRVCAGCVEQERRRSQNRAVVTATGLNRRGVIATLAAEIASVNGDIQDLSQSIVAEYFTLIFVVELRELTVPFAELKARIQTAAERLGIHVVVMHEDVMTALQRV